MLALLIFLFMLPQMAMSQTQKEYDANQRAYEKYKKNNRYPKDLQDILKENKNHYPFAQNTSISKQKFKKEKNMFFGIFITVIGSIVFIGVMTSLNKKSQPVIPAETKAKEQQVAAILEQKNLEKIVEEGLATTIIKVRCRSCSELNEEGAKFCVNCGKKV